VRPWSSVGPKVVVTGATGAVGQHVARELAAVSDVRSLVRDADKAARLGLPEEIVVGDYQDRVALARVLTGADAVFMVTANPLRPQDDENILAAARTAGVRRAVKVSWLAVADPAADDLIARWNRDSEVLWRASELSVTVLRMRTPMSSTLSWAASIREESVVRALSGTARTACVDPRDVAEVAVQALTCPGHEGNTYALTGPEMLSARDQTEQLSLILRRPLRFEPLTPDQALERWSKRYPEPIARALLEGAERRAAGAAAHVEGAIASLTGRAPATYGSWAADHAAAFR
jgi:uncharacterized protein YbjT (DUF2867 family)